jgi:formylglycine-generating enzyme required for sulfatase activity
VRLGPSTIDDDEDRMTREDAERVREELLAQKRAQRDTGAGTVRAATPRRPRAHGGDTLILGLLVSGLSAATVLAITRQEWTAAAPYPPISTTTTVTAASVEARAARDTAEAARVDAWKRVRVPAGSFAMGAAGSDEDERSSKRVMIDAFDIDAVETTVRAWNVCEARGACPALVAVSQQTSPECNAPHADRLDHPVNCVTWSEAAAFCQWDHGRLPTEAEWEYAAAGGSEGHVSAYPWGASPNALLANAEGEQDGFTRTAPVGSFPRGASNFGVLDMAGNVEEWTSDSSVQVLMAGVSLSDPRRITRGGSYENAARDLRTSRRAKTDAGTRAPTIGFRCVHTPS